MDVLNDHGPYDSVHETQAAAHAELDGALEDPELDGALEDAAVDDPAGHDGEDYDPADPSEGYEYPVFDVNGLPNGYRNDSD